MFAEILKKLRKSRKLTQKQFAQEMYLSPSAVSLKKQSTVCEPFWDQFYTHYSRFLYYEALKYCSAEYEAEDLVQEVWLKLCTKESQLSSYNTKQQLAYLAISVRNTAISMARQISNECSLDFAMEISIDEADILNEAFDHELRMELFQRLWPTVPAEVREILERKYILQESNRDIGATLHISANSVRMYLTRARKTAFLLLIEHRDNLL